MSHISSPLERIPTFLYAFDRSGRTEILKRDHYECIECGRAAVDGYALEAAHYDHNKDKTWYADIDNGRSLCRKCHWNEHFEIMDNEPTDWSIASFRLKSEQIWHKGYHERWFYEENPKRLIIDRWELLEDFREIGVNPTDFITLQDGYLDRQSGENKPYGYQFPLL